MATGDYAMPPQLTAGQVQNCAVPYEFSWSPPSTSFSYVVGPADVWCVRVDGDVYLFRSEVEALRWVVSHHKSDAEVFKAKYNKPLGAQS